MTIRHFCQFSPVQEKIFHDAINYIEEDEFYDAIDSLCDICKNVLIKKAFKNLNICYECNQKMRKNEPKTICNYCNKIKKIKYFQTYSMCIKCNRKRVSENYYSKRKYKKIYCKYCEQEMSKCAYYEHRKTQKHEINKIWYHTSKEM